MAPKSILALNFTPDIDACDPFIRNGGSLVKYAPLPCHRKQGRIYTLGLTAAANPDDDEISVYISAADPVEADPIIYLEEGLKLYFSAAPNTAPYFEAVVEETMMVSGMGTGNAINLPVSPLASGIAAAATADTWAMLSLIQPTDIPLADTTAMVEGTNLRDGMQFTQYKVGLEKASQIAVDLRPDDIAFWKHVYPGTQDNRRLFAYIFRPIGMHVWGPCQVSNHNLPGQIKEGHRGQYQHNWQPPYAAPTLKEYLEEADQVAALERAIRLAGL